MHPTSKDPPGGPGTSGNKLSSHGSNALLGTVSVPGDKSISHRALMFSSLAVGESHVEGLLEGEDVLATAEAMRQMGADISRNPDGSWTIHGVGVGGLGTPDDIINLGNSGTSARLLLGLVSSHDLKATFTGDASLRKRPMGRVTDPLSAAGAQFSASEGGRFPLTVTGTDQALPLDYKVPVASAQVKSALLLAGLNTAGTTRIYEATATRDHTERMLSAMGADLKVAVMEDGARQIDLTGPAELNPIQLQVPGDISSAAFLLVAASIVPGSDILLEGVGMNPLRTGIIHALKAMGADISVQKEGTLSGEPVADLRVRYKGLQGIDGVPVHPSTMIDEFPVLFVAAAAANGPSRFRGLEELRVKESDRLEAMADVLTACGVRLTLYADGMDIEGVGTAAPPTTIPGGATIDAHLDHRIAMSSAVLGLICAAPVTIPDASPIETSFPGFMELMNSLGASLKRQ